MLDINTLNVTFRHDNWEDFLYSPAKLFETTMKVILIINRMSFFIADMEILYKFAYICHVFLLLFFVIMAVLCETFHVSHSVI